MTPAAQPDFLFVAPHPSTAGRGNDLDGMNKFTFDSSWNQVKGKLRQKFGQLTDDDLEFAEGKGEELFGRLEQKLGVGASEIHRTLNDIKSSLNGNGVRETLEQARAKATEVAGDLKAKATEVADEFKHVASVKAEEFKAQAGEVYEHARQRARTVHEDAEEYVRTKPREAVFTALAAGFVVGLMIRR